MRFRVVAMMMVVMWVWTGAMAQDTGLDPDAYAYDMYYPKRAKGSYPTVYDPGQFDSINLYNGAPQLHDPHRAGDHCRC